MPAQCGPQLGHYAMQHYFEGTILAISPKFPEIFKLMQNYSRLWVSVATTARYPHPVQEPYAAVGGRIVPRTRACAAA
ncbi:hypothetical protein EVAR_19466_1 [Eumeta japonica]|uniref:Uncharacterized protein n=1 Tax=Eumeta variegata TaxID=151549 RepID=A0A4C1V991_EUMVA|nr:hypothetical protein EVAR_19466_1 [Eumeta japonica]